MGQTNPGEELEARRAQLSMLVAQQSLRTGRQAGTELPAAPGKESRLCCLAKKGKGKSRKLTLRTLKNLSKDRTAMM